MSRRAARIARRGFLIGAVAVAGGVGFGTYLLRRDTGNPLVDLVSDGEAAITPYVIVDATGVTLVCPRAELGQGATQIQAALLAEEMDLDWDAIRTIPGPPSAAYYNAVIAGEGLPIAATDAGYLAQIGRAAGEGAARILGLQITGGSSTVADAYDKLRAAGAVARETLILAAARRTGLAAADLTTRDGAVRLPDGRTIAYGALAAEATNIAPPREVALRDPATWRLLGKSIRGLDTRDKVNGTARYGIDFDLPGMVHAAIRQPPAAGSVATRIDTDLALAVRGVERVVRVGDAVAVLARGTYPAIKAARRLGIDWSDPGGEDSADTFARLEAAMTETYRDSRWRDDGGAATPPAQALQMTYRVPYLAHAALEPMAATAQLLDGVLRIWTSTQVPIFLRDRAADLAGVASADVVVTVLPAGGSFGRRLELDGPLQAVALALETEGRPVKLTWTREEDMTHDFPRPAALARATGWTEGGRVAGLDLAISAPSTAASQMGRLGYPAIGPDVAIVAGAWDQPFAIPNLRVTGYRAPEAVGVSSWRSVGASANAFFHESAMDELIHEAGADPLEERLRLCTHPPSARVLEEIGALSNWGTPLPEGQGRGLAFCLSFGVPVAEVVEVAATDTGIRLLRAYAVAELGRVLDPVNCENQMQGGLAWGLGHAMQAMLTYARGRVQQTNFDTYRALRMPQCPDLVVRALETTDRIRGIGEPTVPPAAPALANAIFAATGRRLRDLPLSDAIRFA